ncbi:MAG: DUF5723 family protein [Bacteroidota bacterium]
MTKIKLTFYFIILIAYISPRNIKGQTNTLYFMDGVHQSVYLNPAYQSSCNGFLGLPVLSDINLNAAHTGFSFQDLFKYGTGNKADSLVLDIDNVKNKIGNSNYLMADNTIPLLGLGFWIKNSYFTFGLSNKTKARVAYPGDLIKITDGNANYIGEDNPVKIKDIGPDVTNYYELAFGLSKRLTHRLFIGGRLKLLSGLANVESKKSNIRLYTEEKTYNLHLETEFDYNISGPVDILMDSLNQFKDVAVDESNIVSDVIPNKNFGLGIDLGATYQFNDELKFYGSITDLGFIRWSSNPTNLKSNGSFDFTGLSLDSIASDSDYSEFNALADSLKELIKFNETNDKYSTFLNTNIYLGASYDLASFINFALLSRTSVYDRKLHQAFTLSANLKPVKWFNWTLSYSIANRSFNSVGMGMAIKGGPFQFYLLTDNLNAALWPKGAKTFGIQLGLNLAFGCGKRDDYSIINNKKLKKDIDFM